MARKSEKSKARAKSPDVQKSPRRVGRPSRRRKKSDSESSEEKKTTEPAEVEQGESSESGRMRRSTRRQPEPSTSEPKPQNNEWKEDESFWSKDKEEEEKNKTEAGEEEGGTVWKVQTSNGSGGEIQKLRICRQRPGGAGSDSAESSMSPAKDSSSPLHKKVLKKESQKSPLVESNLAEIELPPVAGTSEPLDTSEISLPPNQASDDAVPETNSIPQKVVEYVYETQPSVAGADKNSPPQVNQSTPAPVKGKGKISPPVIEKPVEAIIDKPTETSEESKKNLESSEKELEKVEVVETVKEQKTIEEPKSVEDTMTADKAQTVEALKITIKDPLKNKSDKETVKEKQVSPSENQPGEASETQVKVAEQELVKEDKEGVKPVESVEDIPPPVEPPPEVQPEPIQSNESIEAEPAVEKLDDNEKDVDKEKTESVEPNQSESPRCSAKDIGSASTLEGRRKSDSSIKSGGSRRSSVSGPANSEYNEPLLEISVNKSPMHEGKEEGEIVDDERTEVSDHKDKRRVISVRTKSEESTPAKIAVNRRRSNAGESSTTNSASKMGSTPGSTATTAKKHPLITGPEPDESPAVRRRKLTALTTTSRTITSGGTSRPVRSIPGEALKAVLLPEAEKKDKEKRPKVLKVKDEKADSGGGELSTHESKVNKVEDVRELLKNNRANEKKTATDKESKHLAKSPVRTTSSESKAPIRKVSISTAPVVEDGKPSMSDGFDSFKSPGDGKASPILFITNLVRPFTAGQLKELLARTGTIVRNGFFIDKIKSKCFVKYSDVEMATETRHALNGVRWPVSNPKVLKVAYATEKELKVIQDSAEGEIVDDITSPRSSSSGWLSSEQAAVKDKEKRKISGPSTREWDRGKTKTGSDGDVIFIDEYSKEEKLKNALLHQMERSEKAREHHEKEKPMKEEHLRNHSDKDKDRERDRRKRRSSPMDTDIPSPPPARKFKKKNYDAPAKLLDDLFRKTKTSPCLYWLPLSAEQIAVKEETRRKHMAEHERRMAELKKSAQPRRDKERDRDRDRRRK